MKKIAFTAMTTMLLSLAAMAQDAALPKVTALTMPDNSPAGEITGNISSGQKIPLRWAESSQVACFPGTRFEMFNGNHVLYRVGMPAGSKMKITLTPKGGSKLSLYALRQGVRPADHAVPPNVRSAISCEASYPLYANVGGGRRVTNEDDGTRSVEYISVNAPYSILIGVAGAEGATEGDFALKITVEQR